MAGAPDSSQEIAEKSRYWTSHVVEARLLESFADADRRTAALLLANLVGETPGGSEEDSDEATCRLMLAALKVSEGDLTRLAMWVEVARLDPRDLLGAAEYPRELQEGSDEARRADLLAYMMWVQGNS